MLRIRHLVIVRHGDLPGRAQACPLHGCLVDLDGFTTCQHIACPACGLGPPVSLPSGHAYCEACEFIWQPVEA